MPRVRGRPSVPPRPSPTARAGRTLSTTVVVIHGWRPAPLVLATAPLGEGALGADAVDDGDRDPRVAAGALRAHARAGPHAARVRARQAAVDEEVIGERLVQREIVEMVEHAVARAADD